MFKRVRLHLAELTNWNNRPKVSLPLSVPSPTRYLKILDIIPHNTLIGVRQGRGESPFLSGPSACYYNREHDTVQLRGIQWTLFSHLQVPFSVIIDDLYLLSRAFC